MITWIKKNVLYIAWAQSLVATLGSLYFSEVLHQIPCVLCWYQRITIYPLVIILAVGILRKSLDVAYYVLPLALIGFGISIYHNLLQYGFIAEKLAPCVANIPCVTDYYIGNTLITIPLLTLFAYMVIIGCMLIYNKTKNI